MSDEQNKVNLSEMDIGQLRNYAKHARVVLDKTATKAQILEALERKLSGKSMPEFADANTTLKPGYAKIRILMDQSPDASNQPVYLHVNTSTYLIPRDVDVIVPMKVVRTLNDATVMRRKQSFQTDANGRERHIETQVRSPSYPFQILDMVPGPEVLNAFEEGRMKSVRPRERYRDMFGHWPKAGELTRAIEQKLISLVEDEVLLPSEEKLLEKSMID